jgi:predicted RNA binding protein YcfA (HicA-like mRNA interferase family)
MKFRELEKLLLEDGWIFKNAKGSHYQYTHPVKSGKITVPNHPGDISPVVVKAVLKQAGL